MRLINKCLAGDLLTANELVQLLEVIEVVKLSEYIKIKVNKAIDRCIDSLND